MPELIPPTVALHRAWLAAREDWGRDTHQPGSGLSGAYDVDDPAGFAAWVQDLRRQSDESIPPAAGRVHATFWWIAEDGAVSGSISLRHRLNEQLLEGGGHIGYGIRPAARGRGLAGWALARVLDRAREHGLDRVLVTCTVDNTASARVIERAGGTLEDVRDTWLGLSRRYWIPTPRG